MRHRPFLAVAVLSTLMSLGVAQTDSAGPFLAKDGQPQSEIVISEEPARMAKLAAEELQAYVEKITGAKLPISTAPSKNCPVTTSTSPSGARSRM